ncbi:MAG: Tol-Pal system protein TolB, partial [Aestuariibacter sp.]|nr:Tol-Pal system protein TolB [Aestuariibacter sp.]
MSFGVHAALTIEITSGIEGALPIAVVPFDTSKLNIKLPADIASIVSQDLNRSGVLKVLENTALP